MVNNYVDKASLSLLAIAFIISTSSANYNVIKSPTQSEQKVSIVGKWESVSRSEGGIGSTLEFLSDSTINLTPGAMIDFTYHLNRARLVMFLTNPGTGEVLENSVNVHITADSMIQSDPKSGQETRFVRLERAKVDTLPIVGTWSFKHSTGGMAFQVFTADGDAYLRVPFRTDRGIYTISGESLTIFIEGQDSRKVRYAIDGAMLTLLSADGSRKQYNQVPW